MFKKRLFERIKDLDSKNNHTSFEEEQIGSIISYLISLLSVRKGSYIVNQDFGMNNLFNNSDDSFSQFILNAQEEIENEITNYEPRLKDVVVTYNGSDNNNHIFIIEANLVANENKKLLLNSTLCFNGRISVEEDYYN